MQIAILAGGLGKRLGKLTRNQPKSLVEAEGKPFLAYQLELLRTRGIKDVVLCIGHLGEQIERHFGNGNSYGVSIKYSVEDELLGTAGALKKAEALLDDTFFTVYGDSYLPLDFSQVMSYFKSQDKLALTTVYRNCDCYDRSNIVVEGNLVKRYSKKEKCQDMVYIDYGANIFKKKALKLIPEDQVYSLEDLFVRLIEMKELLAFEVKERFYEIGSPQGLRDFQEFARNVLCPVYNSSRT